ncbi:MAG: hypothetical protein AAFV53_22895 [Myxococcota bacterium]
MMVTAAWGCEPVEPVRESLQVAWISPVKQKVRGGTMIEVVQVRDLRAWIRNNSPEEPRVLQMLGMHGRATATADDRRDYKITIFDVRREWLCRPLEGGTPGTDVSNVPVCAVREQQAADKHHEDGFTGCGYSMDTMSSTRGMDVFRVEWAQASEWGFTVMPLERFLEGA